MEQDLNKHDVVDELESEKSDTEQDNLSQIQFDDLKSGLFDHQYEGQTKLDDELRLNQQRLRNSEPDEIKLDNFNFEDSQNLRLQEEEASGEESGFQR